VHEAGLPFDAARLALGSSAPRPPSRRMRRRLLAGSLIGVLNDSQHRPRVAEPNLDLRGDPRLSASRYIRKIYLYCVMSQVWWTSRMARAENCSGLRSLFAGC
jgi:hypothetical protein